MDTFSGRLRDALLSEGRSPTPKELSKLCGISRQTAKNWLAMREPTMNLRDADELAKCLRVRLQWLSDGSGTMRLTEHFSRTATILARLDADTRENWLQEGERMAGV